MILPPVTVYRTHDGLIAQRGEDLFLLGEPNLDTLFVQKEPAVWLHDQLSQARPIVAPRRLLAPIQSQEVWAAGVTYLRS
ncbi:MAG: 2-hydroxyhepta-2,4-diene-1,7-dioate isomerase, partial [Verrucomicrobiaceae bacterium]